MKSKYEKLKLEIELIINHYSFLVNQKVLSDIASATAVEIIHDLQKVINNLK